MNSYTVTFADGIQISIKADCREEAQELAIDAMEANGIVHDTIQSIVNHGQHGL